MGAAFAKVKTFFKNTAFKFFIKKERFMGRVPKKYKYPDTPPMSPNGYYTTPNMRMPRPGSPLGSPAMSPPGSPPMSPALSPGSPPVSPPMSPALSPPNSPPISPPSSPRPARRRRTNAKGKHLGQMLRDEIQHFTAFERNELIAQSPEVKTFLDLNPEKNEKGLNQLDQAAAGLSNNAVIDILFANATAGERLIPHLPDNRQLAIAEKLAEVREWSDQIDGKAPSVVRRAANEIESCFMKRFENVNIKGSDDAVRHYFPTMRSDRVDTKVVIANLPPDCVTLARSIPESQRLQTRKEKEHLTILDTGTVGFDHLTLSHFHDLQALQLSISMLPGLPGR
jgi:hypothetical protein